MNTTTRTEQDALSHVGSSPVSTATVDVYGFEMLCEYEYEEGEAPIFWPTDRAHPGTPANANLLACKVGGVDIVDMLDDDQHLRITDALIQLHEG